MKPSLCILLLCLPLIGQTSPSSLPHPRQEAFAIKPVQDSPWREAIGQAMLDHSQLLGPAWFAVPLEVCKQYEADRLAGRSHLTRAPADYIVQSSEYAFTIGPDAEPAIRTQISLIVLKTPMSQGIDVLTKDMLWEGVQVNGKDVELVPGKDFYRFFPEADGPFRISARCKLASRSLAFGGLKKTPRDMVKVEMPVVPSVTTFATIESAKAWDVEATTGLVLSNPQGEGGDPKRDESRLGTPTKASALNQAAARAKARSEEAAKIAAEQGKIDSDLAPLAQAATQAQQTADRGKQAQTEQARQTKAAADAAERLSQLAKPQQEVKDQTAELAKGAPAALPAAAEALARNDPKPAMQQAAQAMQAKAAPQAAQSAEDAAKQARQLAGALRAAAGPDAPAAAQNAPKLAQLAKEQADLNREVAQKAQQARDAAEKLRAELWAGLKDQQAKVAEQTAAMSDRVKDLAPQEDRLDTKAARSTSESAQAFAAAQDAKGRSEAAQSSGQSAQTLTDLARRLDAGAAPDGAAPDGAAPDPSKRQQLQNDANQLAARQQAIAAQAKAIAEGRMLDALQPGQQDLLGRTSDLADDVGLLRTFADQLIPDASARQDANHAAHSIESAIQAQNQAQASLASKAAQPAESQQRKSAAQLGAAAEALDQLGRKMADLAQANPAAPPDEESTDLADSLEAADQAARSQQARDAALAAKLLDQLAKATAQQAQAMGLAANPNGDDPEEPGQPNQSSKSLRGVGLLPVNPLSGEMPAGRFRVAAWDKLPGELRNEILQGASDEGPEEYRSLIKRYFEEVARRGAARSGESGK